MASRNHLARLFEGESVAGMTDGQLLDRFTTRRGASAESAFEALVARHGSMVARVCRSLLRDEHDVEDAFQATFLVLVRRAGSIGERDLLAPWLYGVAHRVARKARAAARRRGREGGSAGFDPPARFDPSVGLRVEVGPILHEEVNRLPEKYRQPVILCHLQGLTHAEAAQELAWPVGTVSVRLARARKILADRLTRRGVTASAALVTTTLATEATAAALAPTWIQTAAVAALTAASGLNLPTTIMSAGAITLARRTSMTMLLSSWKWFAVPLTVALATTTGAVLVGLNGQGDDTQASPTAAKKALPVPPQPVQFAASGPGPLTLIKEEANGSTIFEGENFALEGKMAHLKALGHFEGSDPGATFKIQFSGGKIRYQTPTQKEKNQVITSLTPQEKDQLANSPELPSTQPAEPKLEVDLTGQNVRSGQPIEYRLTAINSGTGPANAVQIFVTLPREGGKLASRPLSLGATFSPKDRKLAWTVARMEPGQSVEHKFSYETNTPGEYRCVVEVVSEPFRATKEMITDVLLVEKPLVVLPNGKIDLEPPPGFFDLPASKPGEPGSPQPVKIGQMVQVEALEALPGRPLTGNRVVRSDGTISLGWYGDLRVVGLNRDQIKVKLIERLTKYLSYDVLGLIGLSDGKPVAILPIQSNRVYVDDQPELTTPAAKEPTGKRAATASPRPMSGPITVKVGQTLLVEVLEALPGRPITGERVVRPDGTISLGWYGDLAVAGLSRDQIKVKVVEHLRRFLDDVTLGLRVVKPGSDKIDVVPPLQSDRVFVADDVDFDMHSATEPAPDGKVQVGQILEVEVLESLPGRPITGWRIVKPDGTISLGFYGDLAVVGLTRNEIKTKVIERLREKLTDEQLGLITTDDQGRKKVIPPVESDRVYVNDAIQKPKPRTDAMLEGLQEHVANLAGKLDVVLGEIERLRRDRDREPSKMEAPGKP